jgi:excinuclease ABC subunit A
MTLAKTYGIDPEAPFGKLPKKHRDLVLYGPSGAVKAFKVQTKEEKPVVEDEEEDSGEQEFELPKRRSGGGREASVPDPFGKGFEGVIPNLRRRYEEGSWTVQEDLEPYRTLRECPACHGLRLKPQSLAVKVKDRGIADYVNLPISEAVELFDAFELTEREALIASRVLREIRERLRFLYDVGVGYLTLNRSAATLSGAVCARRAVDRPASTRQPQAAGDADPLARPRQHGRGCRARRGNHPYSRLRHRSRSGSGRTRRSRDLSR